MKKLALILAALMFIPAVHGRTVRGAVVSGGAWPNSKLSQGECQVEIDCPNYMIKINGEEVGQIICAKSTGAKIPGGIGRIGTKITGAGGAILPKGYPMLDTKPSLCSGCFIHQYGRVGPGSKSLGCVGVEKKAWDKILACGGSTFAITPMNGKRPATLMAQQPKPAPVVSSSSLPATDHTASFMEDIEAAR